ncbi:Hypothetical protein DHA2_4018 [Giardia duodenalis]|uniref:Uncharacterized protein n=1 Tax=Giardia intestinalis TaxID=5741 RepID=V6TG10_GIAIN|nr:Hypothetical protein DHA2_4018 [Giardia intestinalis]
MMREALGIIPSVALSPLQSPWKFAEEKKFYSGNPMSSVDSYKAQALSCINILLRKLGIKNILSDTSQITFEVVNQLALVYFKLDRFPTPQSLTSSMRAYAKEVSLLSYIESKLGITTNHISPKGLKEHQLFDCVLLLEIVYTLIKSEDMPSYPMMSEAVATKLLKMQMELESRDLMERQAEYMEQQKKYEDPKGILSAKQILDRYAEADSHQASIGPIGVGASGNLNGSLLITDSVNPPQRSSQNQSVSSSYLGDSSSPIRGNKGVNQSTPNIEHRSPPYRTMALSRPSTSSNTPSRATISAHQKGSRKSVVDQEALNQEVREMVDLYYDKYLRNFVVALADRSVSANTRAAAYSGASPSKSMSPYRSTTSRSRQLRTPVTPGTGSGRGASRTPRTPTEPRSLTQQKTIQFEEERMKIKLHKMIYKVMQEIHQQEVSYYYKLEGRIAQTLKRALAVERENLRLEAKWKRDELNEQLRQERILKEALATKKANDLALMKEAEEAKQFRLKINKMVTNSEARNWKRSREDEIFKSIESALRREAGARIKTAVDNFELCDEDIDRIVVERLRQYAGAERDVTNQPGSEVMRLHNPEQMKRNNANVSQNSIIEGQY